MRYNEKKNGKHKPSKTFFFLVKVGKKDKKAKERFSWQHRATIGCGCLGGWVGVVWPWRWRNMNHWQPNKVLSDIFEECEDGQLSITRAFSSSLRPDPSSLTWQTYIPGGEVILLIYFYCPGLFFTIKCFLLLAVGQISIKLRKPIKFWNIWSLRSLLL